MVIYHARYSSVTEQRGGKRASPAKVWFHCPKGRVEAFDDGDTILVALGDHLDKEIGPGPGSSAGTDLVDEEHPVGEQATVQGLGERT